MHLAFLSYVWQIDIQRHFFLYQGNVREKCFTKSGILKLLFSTTWIVTTRISVTSAQKPNFVSENPETSTGASPTFEILWERPMNAANCLPKNDPKHVCLIKVSSKVIYFSWNKCLYTLIPTADFFSPAMVLVIDSFVSFIWLHSTHSTHFRSQQEKMCTESRFLPQTGSLEYQSSAFWALVLSSEQNQTDAGEAGFSCVLFWRISASW